MNEDVGEFYADPREQNDFDAMHIDFAPKALLELLQDKVFEIVFPDQQIGKRKECDGEHDEDKDNDEAKTKTGHSPPSLNTYIQRASYRINLGKSINSASFKGNSAIYCVVILPVFAGVSSDDPLYCARLTCHLRPTNLRRRLPFCPPLGTPACVG